MLKTSLFAIISMVYSNIAFATILLDLKPPQITLSGALGGRVDGTTWNSSELQRKVHLLVYSSPGSKDDNKSATDKVKAQGFSSLSFNSVAIVNMKASWLPNAMLAKIIEAKQQEFPKTTFVLDLEKVLVEKWGLKDDASNLLVFDLNGRLIFKESGILDKTKTEKMISLLRAHVGNSQQNNHSRK